MHTTVADLLPLTDEEVATKLAAIREIALAERALRFGHRKTAEGWRDSVANAGKAVGGHLATAGKAVSDSVVGVGKAVADRAKLLTSTELPTPLMYGAAGALGAGALSSLNELRKPKEDRDWVNPLTMATAGGLIGGGVAAVSEGISSANPPPPPGGGASGLLAGAQQTVEDFAKDQSQKRPGLAPVLQPVPKVTGAVLNHPGTATGGALSAYSRLGRGGRVPDNLIQGWKALRDKDDAALWQAIGGRPLSPAATADRAAAVRQQMAGMTASSPLSRWWQADRALRKPLFFKSKGPLTSTQARNMASHAPPLRGASARWGSAALPLLLGILYDMSNKHKK